MKTIQTKDLAGILGSFASDKMQKILSAIKKMVYIFVIRIFN